MAEVEGAMVLGDSPPSVSSMRWIAGSGLGGSIVLLPQLKYICKSSFEEGGRMGFMERGLEMFGANVASVCSALHSPNS